MEAVIAFYSVVIDVKDEEVVVLVALDRIAFFYYHWEVGVGKFYWISHKHIFTEVIEFKALAHSQALLFRHNLQNVKSIKLSFSIAVNYASLIDNVLITLQVEYYESFIWTIEASLLN